MTRMNPSNRHIINKDVEKAIEVLEKETKRRIEDVHQRVEFICASLRAQGNTQISKMLTAVRELTMEEFCEIYEADDQKFLNQQKQQRLGKNMSDNNRKRRLDSFGTSSTDSKRRKSSSNTEDREVKLTMTEKNPSQSVFIHLNKPNKPEVQIQINPELPEDFELSIPATQLSELNDSQRIAVRNQIQQFIDKLNQLKKAI